jgi:hypothetical protein
MIFNFEEYQFEKQLCVKPLDTGQQLDPKLIYVKHCSVPSIKNDAELEEEFFSKTGRFYMYDVKLCHTMTRWYYRPFLKEFLRRGKKDDCCLHLSNSTVTNKFNTMTSIYDLNYFQVLLGGILTMDSDIAIEISNKRVDRTPDYEMYKIEEICKMLDDEPNVKHYMIREEIYTREIVKDKHAPNGVRAHFYDSNVELIKEVIRYDSY